MNKTTIINILILIVIASVIIIFQQKKIAKLDADNVKKDSIFSDVSDSLNAYRIKYNSDFKQ